MPRYFFHLRRNGHLDTDLFGVELVDLAAAEAEARLAIADAMRDAALSRKAVQGEAFEIADAAGRPQLSVSFDLRVGPPAAGQDS